MSQFRSLRIYTLSREIIRAVVHITQEGKAHGDLVSQMRRSSLSIASNIAEGAGSNSPNMFHRHLVIARGSLHELEAQLDLFSDISGITISEQLVDQLDHLSAMLTLFMRRLK